MKLLHFIFVLFLLNLCGSTEAAQVVGANDDLREMILSPQEKYVFFYYGPIHFP